MCIFTYTCSQIVVFLTACICECTPNHILSYYFFPPLNQQPEY